jgi:adenylate cyclase
MATDIDDGDDEFLRGLTGQARRERAELIQWLLAHDFGVQQIRDALIPMLLPADRVVGDDGTYVSVQHVCDATGIDLDLLQRLHHAVGLPRVDDPGAVVQSRADSESVLRSKALIDFGFDADEVVAIVRVLAEGLGHAAEMMRKAALQVVLRPGTSEVQLAIGFEELATKVVPLLGPMIEDLLHLQLRRSFDTEAVNFAERTAGSLPGARQVTVAFADLVGFTELGEKVSPEELERIANRLTELAHDVVVSPVRFVKTIGDAVMFVCSDAVPLLNVVLDLVSAAVAHDLPRLRVGIASGWAASHAGDWYGSPVNIASRITSAARTGDVVVAESVREDVGAAEDFEWSLLGKRNLRGVSDPVNLFAVQRRFEQRG